MTAQSPHALPYFESPAPAVNQPVIPRVGTGVDVHAYGSEDTQLWLAGLFWPGERGLNGHSDGDVVAHAAADALFAASGTGDLGSNFGVDRPDMAGASGVRIVSEAAAIVRAAGFEVGNVSVQLVGNRPKFSGRRLQANRVLSEAAGAPVNVTATTTDGLGITGRGEGVAAVATALVYPVRA